MDRDLFPERAAYRAGPILTGRVVRLLAGYPREVQVSQPVLVAVLAAAGITRVIGLLLASLLQAGTGRGGVRRRWKEMRKGPEFLVTPLRIRDSDGVLCEMEIHGHLPQSALQPADHVQVTVRRQKDPDLPPRAERLVNLTTGQLLTPRTATVWSHLGPVLLLQAMLGVALVAAIASCAVAVA
jgi:hypothetical protein